jgi:hypothetical protein
LISHPPLSASALVSGEISGFVIMGRDRSRCLGLQHKRRPKRQIDHVGWREVVLRIGDVVVPCRRGPRGNGRSTCEIGLSPHAPSASPRTARATQGGHPSPYCWYGGESAAVAWRRLYSTSRTARPLLPITTDRQESRRLRSAQRDAVSAAHRSRHTVATATSRLCWCAWCERPARRSSPRPRDARPRRLVRPVSGSPTKTIALRHLAGIGCRRLHG